MTRARRAALVLAAFLLAAGCGGPADLALEQLGPTLRSVASDGTLVVHGRALNLSEHALEGAIVVVTVRSAGAPAVEVRAPLGDLGAVASLETTAFRVETGLAFDETAQISISFSFQAIDLP